MTFLKGLLSWVLRDEGGFIVPLALGVLGFLGQQKAAETANRGAEAAMKEAERQQQMQDYLLGLRKEHFDPWLTKTLIPRVGQRAQTKAPWAPQAGFWSRQLSAKMPFPRTDVGAGPRGRLA